MSDPTKKATNVKQRYEREWLTIPGVNAVGVGLVDNVVGIIISVGKKSDRVRQQIPAEVEGIPVKIQLTGTLRAQ